MGAGASINGAERPLRPADWSSKDVAWWVREQYVGPLGDHIAKRVEEQDYNGAELARMAPGFTSKGLMKEFGIQNKVFASNFLKMLRNLFHRAVHSNSSSNLLAGMILDEENDQAAETAQDASDAPTPSSSSNDAAVSESSSSSSSSSAEVAGPSLSLPPSHNDEEEDEDARLARKLREMVQDGTAMTKDYEGSLSAVPSEATIVTSREETGTGASSSSSAADA